MAAIICLGIAVRDLVFEVPRLPLRMCLGGAAVVLLWKLVGTGDYPSTEVRWSGSFGSAYLYFVVPRVILFRWEHSRRTLVRQVDFISAPGRSEPGVHRPGGPVGLITNLCCFDFVRASGRFRLRSLHPGHTLEAVRDQTGFDFEVPEVVPVTPEPSAERLALLRGTVATQVADIYPAFAQQLAARMA